MITELSFSEEASPCPMMAIASEWIRFQEEVTSWLGTPFRHCTAVKGRGIDCSLLVGSIYKELGYITHLNYKYYSTDWYIHGKNELILDYMYAHMNKYSAPFVAIREVTDGIYRGDVIALNLSRSELSNHCVIYMGNNHIVHAMTTSGVEQLDFSSYFSDHIKSVFRVYRTE
jgi:cell wall-associated NlpC family hydrolase